MPSVMPSRRLTGFSWLSMNSHARPARFDGRQRRKQRVDRLRARRRARLCLPGAVLRARLARLLEALVSWPRSFMRAMNCFCSSGDMRLEALQHARRRSTPPSPPPPPRRPARRSAAAPPPRPAWRVRRRGARRPAAASPTDAPRRWAPAARRRWCARRRPAAPPRVAAASLTAASAAAAAVCLGRHRLIERREHVVASAGTAAPRSARAARRCACAICTFRFAVMPGFSFSCGFGTLMIVP